MVTFDPGQVVTENGRACKAKLGVKRTEAGNCATRQADKLTIGTAEWFLIFSPLRSPIKKGIGI